MAARAGDSSITGSDSWADATPERAKSSAAAVALNISTSISVDLPGPHLCRPTVIGLLRLVARSRAALRATDARTVPAFREGFDERVEQCGGHGAAAP